MRSCRNSGFARVSSVQMIQRSTKSGESTISARAERKISKTRFIVLYMFIEFTFGLCGNLFLSLLYILYSYNDAKSNLIDEIMKNLQNFIFIWRILWYSNNVIRLLGGCFEKEFDFVSYIWTFLVPCFLCEYVFCNILRGNAQL